MVAIRAGVSTKLNISSFMTIFPFLLYVRKTKTSNTLENSLSKRMFTNLTKAKKYHLFFLLLCFLLGVLRGLTFPDWN